MVEQNKILDLISLERFQKWQFNDFELYNLEGYNLAPGLIDPHIHGIKGYGTEDNSAESFLQMSLALPQYGVTSFLPTIYTQELSFFKSLLSKGALAKGQEKGAQILGLHLEGPFLSPEQPGVQLKKHMQNPNITLMQEFIDLSKNNIINMTVAPELKGMRELALFCLTKDIKLQAGHTNAFYKQILEGMQVGITHATHFFNAMRGMHHRNPGVVGTFLFQRESSVEIIPDGFHVHPMLIKMLLNQKDRNKVVLVSDSLKPTEQEEGPLYANTELVYHDGVVFRRQADNVIAGSSLNLWKGVQNLVSYGIPLRQALRMGSYNTAQVLNLNHKGILLPGYDADFVIFDNRLQINASFVSGTLCYKNDFLYNL